MSERLTAKLTIPSVIYDSQYTDSDTAYPGQILSGYTAHARRELITGSMPNNGALNYVISSASDVFSIAEGYHDGNGTVSISSEEISKIIPENIRSGITILGVTGTLAGTTVSKVVTGNPIYITDNNSTDFDMFIVSFDLTLGQNERFVQYNNLRITLNGNPTNVFHSVVDNVCCLTGYLTVSGRNAYFTETTRCYDISSVDEEIDGFFYNSSKIYSNEIDLSREIVTNREFTYTIDEVENGYRFGIRESGIETVSQMNQFLAYYPAEIVIPTVNPTTHIAYGADFQMNVGTENVFTSPANTTMEIRYVADL